MISVSSSDARKNLGLGFARRTGNMEENEAEDGEASSSSNGRSSEPKIDPDVALSYIDEKLENVLGHLQKDFAGGVSVENLGAKFGGYGSFLPMYQLSPAPSHPKCPSITQNPIVPRSPNNSSMEAGRSNCSASTTAHNVIISGSSSKASSSNILANLKECAKSSNPRISDSKQKITASSNRKALKVRIKVGSNDLASRTNVSAFSRQGLGASPSTLLSVDEEGFLCRLDDSPASILMAMISFPLNQDLLLSPLSDDLIQFGEKEEITKDDKRYICFTKLDRENTHSFTGLSDPEECSTAEKKETEKKSCEDRVIEKKTQENSSYIVPVLNRLRDQYADVKKSKKNGRGGKLFGDMIGECKAEIERFPVHRDERSFHNASGKSLNNKKTDMLLARASASILMEDKWVVCEKCQKRRLLPNGMNLDDIPENWNCSMLSWLPGMNCCTINQDLTTEAVLRMHRATSLEDQGTKNRNPPRDKLPINGQALQKLGEGEERKDLNGIASRTYEGTRKHRPVVSDSDSKHLAKSSNSSVDRHKVKQNDERKTSNHQSDEGGEDLRMEIESNPDQECSGISKKSNTGKSQSLDVDQLRYDKILKGDGTQASATKVKENAEISLHYGCDNSDVPKKRKRKDNQEIGDHVNRHKKRNKLRVSSSDGKEPDVASRLPSTRTKSNSYKLSGSHKRKDSPAVSISSSPSRMLEPDKLRLGKRNLSGKDDSHPTTISAIAGTVRCSENESKTIKKKDSGKHHVQEGKVDDLEKNPDITIGGVKPKKGGSNKKPIDAKEHQDPNAKLDVNVIQGKMKKRRAPPSGSDQAEVLGQGSDVSNTKTHRVVGDEDENVGQDVCTSNPTRKGNRVKDNNDDVRKAFSSQAVSSSIKEATDLKHMADRLKNSGSNLDSTGFYFQAALKFLYGASLLESDPEQSKHKSIVRARQIYDSTAKLCEFCAREYEKCKDMGAAALAYKCMEVAYLRIIYSVHGNMNRYRYELRAALQAIPSGESPCTADAGNLSITSAAEKASSSNVAGSPRVSGSQFISAKNHSYISHILQFSQNAISAMDASRKSQIAFGAANQKSDNVQRNSDGISSIKRALDYNFQDIDGLLHVVRLAMQVICQ